MTSKALISAVINTRNEATALPRCLKSLQGFADEIIIVDQESTDDSVSIARSFNAKIFRHKWVKAVEIVRNFALSKATGQWIILLDPDEYLPKSLKKELLSITSRQNVDFVRIPRKNINFGKWLRHSRCWPDYLIRFFKNGTVTWKPEIHSQPETKGVGITLLDSEKLAINHHNYTSITHFVNRALRYSQVQSDELIASDYKIKISDFLLRPVQEFNSRFFAGNGFKDGLHGLMFCLLQAFSVFLIYARVWEKQGASDKPLPKDSFVSACQETFFEFSFWFSKFFHQEYTHNFFKVILIKIRHFFIRLTKNL